MSTRFVNVDRTTPMLLPPDVREWVQGDDLVHFIVEAVSLLDFSGARINRRGPGSEQYPPSMMLGLLVYCYAQGLFSSRRIERATYQNVSVRYLAGNTHPDHDPIAAFRRENQGLIGSAFVQLLRLAKEAGLLRLGAIALDGTKLPAATTRQKNLTYAQLQAQLGELEKRVSDLLAQAEAADQAEPEASELPTELQEAQARREKLLAAKARLEAQARARSEQREKERAVAPPGGKRSALPPEPRAQDRINLTDAESSLLRTRRGFMQGYNAQLAVEVASGLIVGAEVIRSGTDRQQLQPMVQQVSENVGVPTRVLVDTGYENVPQIQAVEASGQTEVLCPPARSANARPTGGWCRAWRERSKELRARMEQRLSSVEGRSWYRRRKTTVEPVFGIIKGALNFGPLRLRGLGGARTEWLLVSLAINCRRLAVRWA